MDRGRLVRAPGLALIRVLDLLGCVRRSTCHLPTAHAMVALQAGFFVWPWRRGRHAPLGPAIIGGGFVLLLAGALLSRHNQRLSDSVSCHARTSRERPQAGLGFHGGPADPLGTRADRTPPLISAGTVAETYKTRGDSCHIRHGLRVYMTVTQDDSIPGDARVGRRADVDSNGLQ